jgi:predicted SAM-dependent methyltransferase
LLKKFIVHFLIKFNFKSIKHAVRKKFDSELSLEIGAGNVRREGWITSDFRLRSEVILDARRNWSIPGTFSFIYTEMMIASLSPLEIESFFNNCYLSLKKGGVLRICSVNVRRYAEIYLDKNKSTKERYFSEMKSRHPGNKYLFDYADFLRYPFVTHSPGSETFSYDFDSLNTKLLKTGFEKIEECSVGTSNFAKLNNLEKRRSDVLDDLQLIIEAMKP